MPSMQTGARPPYVEFETRSVEDRNASLENGSKKYKDEIYVIVRQAGAKDTVERKAEEWLDSITRNDNYDPIWVQRYQIMFEQYKKGHEITPDGTHVRVWPAVSKAEADTLIAARILTVEDLAAANEESLRRVGMGARALQNKAKAWMQTAKDTGKTAEELHKLREENDYQRTVNEELKAQIAALSAKIDSQPKAKRVVDELVDA